MMPSTEVINTFISPLEDYTNETCYSLPSCFDYSMDGSFAGYSAWRAATRRRLVSNGKNLDDGTNRRSLHDDNPRPRPVFHWSGGCLVQALEIRRDLITSSFMKISDLVGSNSFPGKPVLWCAGSYVDPGGPSFTKCSQVESKVQMNLRTCR